MVIEDVAALKAHAVRHVDLTFDGELPVEELGPVPGTRSVTVVGPTVQVTVQGSIAALVRVAAGRGLSDVVTHQADLEEIFMTYYVDDAG